MMIGEKFIILKIRFVTGKHEAFFPAFLYEL